MVLMPDNVPLDNLFNSHGRLDDLVTRHGMPAEDAYRLASYCANTFFKHPLPSSGIRARAVLILCRMTTSNHPEIAAAGLKGLFPLLVERLSDAFNPDYCALYDQIFSQVIDFYRRHPAGKQIDRTLNRFGLKTTESILARKKKLSDRMPSLPLRPEQYKKCLILSRVTLGAEVAVTSILIAKCLAMFLKAEVILIGDKKTADIFHNLARFRVVHCPYPAGGGLLERFDGWLQALAVIDRETHQLPAATYLVIDPDSRYSQLGLLPLVENDQDYLFFQSRAFHDPEADKIGALTDCWLKQHWGGSDTMPFISLPAAAHHYAQKLRDLLLAPGHTMTAVSFGVGGNNQKRLGLAFELAMLKKLTALKDNTVLFFKGVGDAEIERSEFLLRELAESPQKRIINISGNDPEALLPLKGPADIIAWQGPLSAYCALLAASDVQIGYDSSSQHVAAACGVPTIDIFADKSTPMFIKRWSPFGSGPVRTVQAYDDRQTDAPAEPQTQELDLNSRWEELDPARKKTE